MGWFSDNKREQDAYDEGVSDGRVTRETGKMHNPGRRGTERPNDEARAYVLGHGDGQQGK